ncbi:MAG: hypothetical protein IID44_24640 [Planctomycetes bacterium]|nr:hypothetical protein [Planctomycetota bacterium]
MSFDAKHNDGAGAAPGDVLLDDGLPGDLAALAQQLSDDAVRLTDSYPADAERLAHNVRRRSFWRDATLLRYGALAASLLMMIGGGLWIAGQFAENSAGGGSVATKPNDTSDESSKTAKENVSDVGVPMRPVLAIDQARTGDPINRLTAEDVLKMTGPQLDAYGDIRAEESETMESISF